MLKYGNNKIKFIVINISNIIINISKFCSRKIVNIVVGVIWIYDGSCYFLIYVYVFVVNCNFSRYLG